MWYSCFLKIPFCKLSSAIGQIRRANDPAKREELKKTIVNKTGVQIHPAKQNS